MRLKKRAEWMYSENKELNKPLFRRTWQAFIELFRKAQVSLEAKIVQYVICFHVFLYFTHATTSLKTKAVKYIYFFLNVFS